MSEQQLSKREHDKMVFERDYKNATRNKNNNELDVKCIEKVRDKNNKITGYKLENLHSEETYLWSPEILRKAIQDNKVNIINLKLSSNGRLIDVGNKEKTTENKEVTSKKSTPINAHYIDNTSLGLPNHYNTGENYDEVEEARRERKRNSGIIGFFNKLIKKHKK